MGGLTLAQQYVTIRSHMTTNDLTHVWKALSDPSRRQILDLLKESPKTTGDLCETFEFSRFAVMKHLKVLEKAELIIIKREGRVRWNQLNVVPIQRIYERWVSEYEGLWASSLLGLKHLAEQKGGTTEMTDDGSSTMTHHNVHIEQAVTISAPPPVVFDALVEDMSLWWRAPFFHGDADTTKMMLEPHLGGRMYEDWGQNEGLLLATIVSIKRPWEVRLTGAFGMEGPVSAEIYFQLKEEGQGTQLMFTHRAIGVLDAQAQVNYTSGWETLLGTNLKEYAEQKAG